MNNTIALLATGDELVQGDILNTTGPWLASQLTAQGFIITRHMTVSDDQTEIEQALAQLLADNRVVITTGGLGPTSDDRTRFAIAKVLGLPLEFDTASWQMIVERLTKFNVPVTDNNRQQAYFPQNAQVFHNSHGSANGCIIQHQNKVIVMLPGPPYECRSMYEPMLAQLLTLQIHRQRFAKKWRAFAASESNLAKQIDPLIADSECTIGYRIDYPYTEIKLFADTQSALDKLITPISTIVESYYLTHEYHKSSEQLVQYLQKHPVAIFIADHVTKGYWQYHLLQLANLPLVDFDYKTDDRHYALEVCIHGLDEVWMDNNQNITQCHLTIKTVHAGQENQEVLTIPFRGKRSLAYCSEFMCDYILKRLQKI